MAIKVAHLSKKFKEQKAVDDISFEVKKGEIVGFLGPNGAGKSTTMKILTGFLAKDGGSIDILDKSIDEWKQGFKTHIGYLPEHNPLYTYMYVKEFLQFVGQLQGLGGAQLQNRIAQLIVQVGLEKEQHKKISQLSKGYRQRVGLAQALLHNPDILILDEPTTGLDPNQIAEIRALIKSQGQSKAVLFSTHIMQEVEAICDRVIIINKGKIVVEGSLADIKKQGKNLEEVFRALTLST